MTGRGSSAEPTSVLKTQRGSKQTKRSTSRPEMIHSAYHTGHSGLSTTPHQQVCVQTKTYMRPLSWQRDRAKADVPFERCFLSARLWGVCSGGDAALLGPERVLLQKGEDSKSQPCVSVSWGGKSSIIEMMRNILVYNIKCCLSLNLLKYLNDIIGADNQIGSCRSNKHIFGDCLL